MARITVEDCLSKIGNENRFSLIHLAVERLKQHRSGKPYLVKGKNKEVVMTLREIAAGKVTYDNYKELGADEDLKKAAGPGMTEEIAATDQNDNEVAEISSQDDD